MWRKKGLSWKNVQALENVLSKPMINYGVIHQQILWKSLPSMLWNQRCQWWNSFTLMNLVMLTSGILRSDAEAECPHLPYHTTVQGLAMAMFHCDVLSSRLKLKFLLNEKNHLHPLILNMNDFGNQLLWQTW